MNNKYVKRKLFVFFLESSVFLGFVEETFASYEERHTQSYLIEFVLF